MACGMNQTRNERLSTVAFRYAADLEKSQLNRAVAVLAVMLLRRWFAHGQHLFQQCKDWLDRNSDGGNFVLVGDRTL